MPTLSGFQRAEGISCLARDDPGYPENLRLAPETPDVIYVRGTLVPEDRVAVAVVGTRSPTPEGKIIAYELARDLAGAGVTVVSGLALGIDTEAHLGALDAGGRTIACLGAAVDIPYPRSNTRLFERIPEHGALVSEYGPGTPAMPFRFPMRNRIISGLSLGVVVVEAGEKSGALITAEWAEKQGRPVMAVPGSPKSAVSAGSNRLIQDGAYLVTSARDVLSFLGKEGEYVPEIPQGPPTGAGSLTFEEGAVLSLVRSHPQGAGELAEHLPGLTLGKVVSLLSALEVRGMVSKVAGGKYVARS
ncbi:MAG: DNA-processing protein DprA [Bacillota bacterium]